MAERSAVNGARPYEPRDRDGAIEALGSAAALEAPGRHAHVAEEGPGGGIALWAEPASGEEAYLGAVIVRQGTGRRAFYQLALACAVDARSRGHTRGYFRVRDRALLVRLQRDFRIEAQPCGWAPNSETAVEWEISVELEDAIRQLRQVI